VGAAARRGVLLRRGCARRHARLETQRARVRKGGGECLRAPRRRNTRVAPTPFPPSLPSEFADAGVEATFWHWQSRRMHALDAAAAGVVAVVILVGALQFCKRGYPPGAPLATAAGLLVLAVAAARRGEAYLKHRTALLAAARVAVAACTCVAAWLRPRGTVPMHWGEYESSMIPMWARLAKMPRVYALAVPALGFVLPPRANAVTSAACLAVVLTALESTVLVREAYFGRQANVAIAGALSRAAWRALRPAATAPASVAPHRATALVMVHIQTVALLAAAQAGAAWTRVERARFRAAHGLPRHSGALARTAFVDHALLALALHAGVWLGLWWVLEEVDAWLARGE